MPIPANRYLDTVESHDHEAFKRYDQHITRLVENAMKRGERSVNITELTDVTYAVKMAVHDAWKKAGWKIETHSDQREGTSWTTFTPQRTSQIRDRTWIGPYGDDR